MRVLQRFSKVSLTHLEGFSEGSLEGSLRVPEAFAKRFSKCSLKFANVRYWELRRAEGS